MRCACAARTFARNDRQQKPWTSLHTACGPALEPILPSAVIFVSHHLHCMAHSAVVAGVVTLLVWRFRPALWIPLLDWWSHIVIDVFTHSTDYYASPVFYPFTKRGFDGIAWNTPWFMVLNYLALLATGLWLFLSARRQRADFEIRSDPTADGSRVVAMADRQRPGTSDRL